jgi:HSP20 family protein
MKINRWDPFKHLLTNDFFESFGSEIGKPNAGTWSPSVDVYETPAKIVLTAELPGVDEEDIDLSLYESTLTLKGERKVEKDLNQENYHVMERYYGGFCRRFTLPSEVDGDRISANFSDGVLKVSIPKKSTSKKISVEVTK